MAAEPCLAETCLRALRRPDAIAGDQICSVDRFFGIATADSGYNSAVFDAMICDFSTEADVDAGLFTAGVEQSGLQIGAMANDIGMVPALRSLVAKLHFHQRTRFAPIHEVERFRRYGLCRKTAGNAEPFQMTHRIGCKLQASTDFRKGLGLFDKPDIPAARCQLQCCRQTGNSGPGNQYAPFAHVDEIIRHSAP